MADEIRTVGIVGARGYVGAELIGLVASHPRLRLAFAASRSLAGRAVEIPGAEGLVYSEAAVEAVAGLDADAVVLATPDGAAGAYADALGGRIVLDLSSDHRFDDTWAYGLSEHNGKALREAERISNPGCYATAVQLALSPLLGMIEGTPHAFGVSGYSGAGTTPSARNDLALLEGGVSPYKLVGHTHEREVSRHLGRTVRFSPGVGPFFRGITAVVQARARTPIDEEDVLQTLLDAYASCSLIEVVERTPRVQDVVGLPAARVGGVVVSEDRRDFGLVCVIDNLLKGAASQAVQNLNLAFGFERDESLSVASWEVPA
ncbi:MAG: N-acetyl-gamma-glutamyl-phosphate reductase [Planctomycetota bacterium]